MGRGRISVYLSCLVLSATGLAIALTSALWTAHAQTLAFRGRPVFRAPPASALQSCLGERQTFGDSDPARVDLVRCALPRSTDTTSATASSANTGTTQANPTGVPQQGTVGATQPTTSVSQPSTDTPTTQGTRKSAIDLGFAYYPPGDLDSHDANRGRKGDRKVYLPNIIFPLRLAPDQHPHMNSQIWGHGGSGWDGKGEAGGSECDPVNYDPMLQRDTYCEVRTWAMPMCPGGAGHQGQDIRPPTCKDNTWEVVAVVDGIITQVTPNTTVRLKGADGTDYWYLHMHPQSITVKVGQSVKQGDVLGHVSRYMDGDPNGTTTHLHFQVRQTIRVDGKILSVYVPDYTSLIAAYRKAKGIDPGIGPDGNLIVDARFEIGAPKAAPSSQSAPVADQSTPSGQAPAPTAGSGAQQPPTPAAPSPVADQSTQSGQAPAPTAGPAQPPTSAPSSPVGDQSTPSGQPPAPTAGSGVQQPPAPAAPSPTADQSPQSGQTPAPTAGPAQPPTSAPAPGGEPSQPTTSPVASQPPSPATPSPPADQSAPPVAGSSAPPPPAPTTDQGASTQSSGAASPQPTTTAPASPQPPQSWWQRTWSSAKEWWNKLGK